jgi:hypothetical protein
VGFDDGDGYSVRMADALSGPVARCPWCSAELPTPAADRCPACGAVLASTAGGPEPEIKGVTTLDTEAIIRARAEVARPRSRILEFITGEVPPETGGPASPESLARPPAAVRREMLRLQHDAERAEREAETLALKVDVLARRGIHVSELGSPAPDPAEGDPADAGDAAPGPGDAPGA